MHSSSCVVGHGANVLLLIYYSLSEKVLQKIQNLGETPHFGGNVGAKCKF